MHSIAYVPKARETSAKMVTNRQTLSCGLQRVIHALFLVVQINVLSDNQHEDSLSQQQTVPANHTLKHKTAHTLFSTNTHTVTKMTLHLAWEELTVVCLCVYVDVRKSNGNLRTWKWAMTDHKYIMIYFYFFATFHVYYMSKLKCAKTPLLLILGLVTVTI